MWKWILAIFAIVDLQCVEPSMLILERSCYRRLQIGKRLDDRLIRHSLPCDTIQACQHQCSVEQHFECHGFNIRLDENGLGRGVCELTSVPTPYIDLNRDFHLDSEFDFYEKDVRNTSPNCGYINEVVSVIPRRNEPTGDRGRTQPPPPLPSPRPPIPPIGDSRYGPGPWAPGSLAWRKPTTSGVGRPHPNEIPIHTTVPKEQLYHFKKFDPHARSMPFDNSGHRLPGYLIIDADQNGRGSPAYINRNEQGRSYPPPNSNQILAPGPNDNFHGHPTHNSWVPKPVCYQRMYPASRLRPTVVREMHYMSSVLDCEEMCNTARFQCSGFTYRYTKLSDRDANCFLTDIRAMDPYSKLMPDRECDVYLRMSTCMNIPTLPDTECFMKVARDTQLSQEVLKVKLTASSVTECELECLRTDHFICRSFAYRFGTGDNCYLSDWPIRDLRANHVQPGNNFYIYERGSFGRGCELDSGPPYMGPNPNEVGFPVPRPQPDNQPWQRDAWMHFTVRGWPCRRGSQCALNKEAGFWSCEVEGGDHKQWDYCCRPQHACGYSQGYSYPWCYVGEVGPEQWRPCSDHFYPNHGNDQPHPPPRDHDFGSWSSEYGPPDSWPITYLYTEPPPNETVYYNPDFHNDHRFDKPGPPSYYEDSPKIKFKPSRQSYPKAVVQKLDIKDASSPIIPEHSEEEFVGINPRVNYSKKITSDEPKFYFGTSGNVSSKNGSNLNQVKGSTVAEFNGPYSLLNDTMTSMQVNKTKEILDQIEQIIEKSVKAHQVNCSDRKDELNDRSHFEGVRYASGFFNTTSGLVSNGGDNAMNRFWNWGQENYFSKDSKT